MIHPALNEHAHYADAHTGTLPIPEYDLIMRVSTVGSADLCPARVTLRDHDGYDDSPAEAMLFGTIEHSLIEHQIEPPHLPPTMSDALQAARQAEARDRLPFSIEDDVMGTDSYLAWVAEALGLASGWRRWARHNLTFPLPNAVTEQRMAAPLCTIDGRRVWLAGTADLILPGHRLGADWKTAAKGWPAARAAQQNQHNAYAWLAQQVYGYDLREWWFVVGSRARQEWERHEVPVTQAGIDGFLTRARALAKSLHAGTVFYHPKDGGGRRGWWCSAQYCNAWNLCAGRLLGDEKDRQVRPSALDTWGPLTLVEK